MVGENMIVGMETPEAVIENCRASIEKEDLAELFPILRPKEGKYYKPRRTILEIGMHRGLSAKTWIEFFAPNLFIGIEKDPKPEDAFEYSNPAYIYLWEHDSHTPDTLHKVEGLLDWQPTIDFLFIDGDHSYEGVKKDFEMYAPLVKKGGVIVFHDALYHADKTEEVDIFWNELKETLKFTEPKPIEIKASKNSTGIGVIQL